jgi:hypothetical protein
MNLYADIYAVRAIQHDRYQSRPPAPHGPVRQWIGTVLGTPLIRAGAKLLEDPVALRLASSDLAVRAEAKEQDLAKVA